MIKQTTSERDSDPSKVTQYFIFVRHSGTRMLCLLKTWNSHIIYQYNIFTHVLELPILKAIFGKNTRNFLSKILLRCVRCESLQNVWPILNTELYWGQFPSHICLKRLLRYPSDCSSNLKIMLNRFKSLTYTLFLDYCYMSSEINQKAWQWYPNWGIWACANAKQTNKQKPSNFIVFTGYLFWL